MEASGKDIDLEQLGEYSKALKDYKKTGTKQCLAILNDLLESNLTLNQLKETKIGTALSKIAKEESNDPDEKTLKDLAVQLFKKCKQRDDNKSAPQSDSQKSSEVKTTNGNGTASETKKSEKEGKESASPEKRRSDKSNNEEKKSNNEERKPKSEEKTSRSEAPKPATSEPSIIKKKPVDEPRRENPREISDDKKRDSGKDSAKKSASKDNGEGLDKLPYLNPEYRNFTLKSFSDGLLSDYKGNPSEKDRLKPISHRRSVDIEKALFEKSKGSETQYRMDARDLSTFLLLKANSECRKRLMDGSANCAEFVVDRNKFLNKQAQERLEEHSRRMIDANNADYDKKIIRESQLYQCKKCKSKRISKTEKQTRSGDEPMTSFFNCVDCGAGWKE